MGGAPVRIKCEVEISAILNYAIVHQLAFFAFVCITQLFLAVLFETQLLMYIELYILVNASMYS